MRCFPFSHLTEGQANTQASPIMQASNDLGSGCCNGCSYRCFNLVSSRTLHRYYIGKTQQITVKHIMNSTTINLQLSPIDADTSPQLKGIQTGSITCRVIAQGVGVSTTLADHHTIKPFKNDYFFHPNMFGTFSKEESTRPTFAVNQARSTHFL